MRTRILALIVGLFVAGSPLAAEEDWLSPGVGGLRSSVQAQGAILDLMRASLVNVKSCTGSQMFCASGSAQVTTGSITAGSTALTVASAIDFAVGQGISVHQAGPANALLVAKVTAISGTTITLDTAASVTRSGVAVVHDDTAAIQAAIDSFGSTIGGPVFLPRGTYVISSSLLMRTRGAITGPDVAVGNVTTSYIDGTRLGVNSGAVVFANGSQGAAVRNLRIAGPLGTGTSSIGVELGDNSANVHVENVFTTGFYYGLQARNANYGRVVRSSFTGANMVNLDLYNCNEWVLDQVLASNVQGVSGNNANIRIYGYPWPATYGNGGSRDIEIRGTLQDEAFGASGTASTILILAADRVTISDQRIWWSGSASWGIRLGDGTYNPTNCTIMNTRVEGYAGGSLLNSGIELRGSGHTLLNVSAEAGSAPNGHVNDLATGTTMINVNGAYKLPSLPTTAPAAGSKLLWADPADSYRVKLAN